MMAEVFRNFTDSRGNPFTVPFDTQEAADAFEPPEGCAETPFVPKSDDELAAEAAIAYKTSVKYERARRLKLPVPIALQDGRSFALDIGDMESRTNIQGRVAGAQYALSVNDLTAQPFRDHANDEQQLTPSDWIEIGLQIDAWRTNIYEKSWALMASSTQVDVTDDKNWAV